MKDNEKRKPRSYKASDRAYKKAMKRAKKEKSKLSNLLEDVIEGYGNGLIVTLQPDNRSIT